MMSNRIVSTGSSAPIKGVVCSVVGGLLFTLNDALVKFVAGDYPTGQLMFVRGIFVSKIVGINAHYLFNPGRNLLPSTFLMPDG